ncbi:large protein [Hexartovirus lepeophtheiri]|uniref:RNA-directed RNA polymerase n=1 Tax=Lepeophtheirus virus LS24 TaxID=2080823 RepID=A0A3G1NGZ1_9MONO|nr:large protein [Lepeophtheirus virus LS24]AUZ99699.1 large protein [Lepeophtheirus virus LS24]
MTMAKPLKHKPWSFDYTRHLDSPLTQNNLLFYKHYPARASMTYPNLSQASFIDLQSGFVKGKPLFRTLERFLNPILARTGQQLQYPLSKIITIVEKSVSWQADALSSQVPHPLDRSRPAMFNAIRSSHSLRECCDRKLGIMALHEELVTKSTDVTGALQLDNYPQFKFQSDLIEICDVFPIDIIITYDMLLCVLDKIEARFTFLLLLELLDTIPVYRDIRFSDQQRALYDYLDGMTASLGNQAHYILKALEACSVGVLLEMEPTVYADHQYLTEIIAGFVGKSDEIGKWGVGYINILRQWGREFHDECRVGILEAYGQEKLHFYPILDDEGGQIKMYRVGTSFREVNRLGCKRIHGYLTQELIWSYFSKRKELPKIIPSLNTDARILAIFASQVIPNRSVLFDIEPEVWAELQFAKTFQFDYRPDNFDHLLDKSIAPNMENINQIWHPDARKEWKLLTPSIKSDRRFIEWVMKQPTVDCEEYLHQWNKMGKIPTSQLAILATAKEREQKNESRSYSILHPIPRVVLTTIEHNLSETILPLLPHHSMKLSGPQLQKRIEQFVHQSPQNDSVTIFFTLDYEQWNYTFRDRSTYYFDQMFNNLFGESHFLWPNYLFRHATFFTGNPFTPPENPMQFTTWTHHAGGNQGIRQKFWTIITQAAIGLAMEQLGYPYQLIGSGDNQVLAVKIPPGDGLLLAINRVKMAIRTESSHLGIVLKLSETFHSSRLFVYQRRYFSDGLPISLIIKSCVRFFAGSSEGAPTIANVISTSQNSGIQVSSASGDPLIGIIAGHTESYLALLNHPAWPKESQIHGTRLAAISLLSSDLMPLNFLQLTGFLYSGHQDMLTESLALMNHIYHSNPLDRVHIAGAVTLRFKGLVADWALALLLDPKSPNIDWPQTAEAMIREKLRTFLLDTKITRNKQILTMLSNLNDMCLNNLASAVLSMRPLNLSIGHSLFESSRTGQVLASVNRFTKTRTLVKLVKKVDSDEGKESLSLIVRSRDKRLITTIADRISSFNPPRTSFYHTFLGGYWSRYVGWCTKNHHATECSYNVRRYLMIISYQLLVEDIYGPYCPAPFEQVKIVAEFNPELFHKSILISPARNIPHTVEECEYTRGPFTRYVGSGTASRVQSYKFFNLSGGDMSTAVNMLFSLGTWLYANGNCNNLLGFVIAELEARIPGLSSIFHKVKTASRGGCLEHRFSSPGDVTGAYSSNLSLVSTHYRLNTDKASSFNRSELDFELFFQATFHYLHSILRFCTPLKTRVLAVITMEHCTRQIVNQSYKASNLARYCPGSLPSIVSLSVMNQARLSKAMRDSFLASNPDLVRLPNREAGLVAYMCESAAIYIRRYQSYHRHADSMFSMKNRPESVLNLSLFKEVPLAEFLLSLVVTLDYHGAFGEKANKSAISFQLHNWSRAVSGIVDVSMFKFITDAITQTGRLQELCAIAGTRSRYIRQNRSHSLAPVLLVAMASVGSNKQFSGVRWSIIVKEPGSGPGDAALVRIIKRWCKSYALAKKNNSILRPLDWGQSLQYNLPEGLIITCNLAETVEERARGLPHSDLPHNDYFISPGAHWSQSLRLRLPVDNITVKMDLDDTVWGEWEPRFSIQGDGQSLRSQPTTLRMYQAARWAGIVSGAWLKLAFVLKDHWEMFLRCEGGLFLAEGGGSMLAYCLHANPRMKAVYNSLYEIEITDGVEDGGYTPPAILCECGASKRVVNIPYLDEYYGDLSSSTCRSSLYHHMDSICSSHNLAVMDMDNWGDGRIQILISLLVELTSQEYCLIIFKMFQLDKNRDKLFTILTNVTDKYNISVVKPLTSNPLSGEYYLTLEKRAQAKTPVRMIRSLEVWDTIISSVGSVRAYDYLKGVIQLSKTMPRLPSCLDGSPISVANKYDKNKYSMATIYEAFLTVMTLRRDLVGDRNLLSREIGVLFHSSTYGSRSMQENFWSLMVSTAAALLLAAYTGTEVNRPGMNMGIESFYQRLLPLLSKSFLRFTIPHMVDLTWRRIGYLFRKSHSFGSQADIHFLLSIDHYTSVTLDKLRVRFTLPRAICAIIALSKREYELRVSHELPLLLFQSGLKLIEHVLRRNAQSMGDACRIVQVSPDWMEDILRSRYWPVHFSEDSRWGLVIGSLDRPSKAQLKGLEKIVMLYIPTKLPTIEGVVPVVGNVSLYEFAEAGLNWRVKYIDLT